MAKNYFGMGDKIVRDSLLSIDFEGVKDLVIVGGMVPQIYAQGRVDTYRNTLDADLVKLENSSFDDFKDLFFDSSKLLRKMGYQTQFKKGRGNNSLKIMTSQHRPDSQDFYVNLDYMSPDIYESFKPYLQSQINNSKIVSFEGKNLRVSSLEEILPLKLNRSINHAQNKDLISVGGGKFIASAIKGNWKNMCDLPLDEARKEIDYYQNKCSSGCFSVSDLANYKIKKDVFDLIASAKIISDGQYDFDNSRYKENVSQVLNH